MNQIYKNLKYLGSGILGTVYQYRHVEPGGQVVALKTFLPEVSEGKGRKTVLRDCIAQAYAVRHPNVVQILEYLNNSEAVTFSMEYVDGGSLADELGAGYQFDLSKCTHLLSGILMGLQAIHAAGIVVQNIKPENILLTSQGDPKVSDYFLGKYFAFLSSEGVVTGSMDYIAPEYIKSGAASQTTDIYSVGCIAYELITGQAPFYGASVAEVMKRIMVSTPKPPSVVQPSCPSLLDDWVLKFLSNDPNDRFQSAAEALRELDELIINLRRN